jgi:hypothetical protein
MQMAGMLLGGIIWGVYYSFFVYAVALRQVSGKAALDYSKATVQGEWWRVFGYLLALGFLSFLGQITITEQDVVCDLPYPLQCGLWFDHHEGNVQELEYRKIDPKSIPGRFDLKPSCSRVVYEYFPTKKNYLPIS